MAFKRPFRAEDLSCPVCQHIFTNPVILTCSHSVCKDCLTKFWEVKGTKECPMCGKRLLDDPPLLNLILKNLCESFVQEENKRALLCSQHKRKLELYCLEDKEPVCVVCRDLETHQNHNFSPIGEIASGIRGNIMVKLQGQENNLKSISELKLACDKMSEHIETQFLSTEKQIKEEFEKLHQFLRDEEAARIAALKEEEKQQARMMKMKLDDARKDVLELTKRIRETEEDMAADDASVVLNYKTIVERTDYTLWVLRVNLGELIDVAKHLGNVKFSVWEKMQEIVKYTPVVLDPNTAHPELSVSADLTSVRWTEELQPVPPNPERSLQNMSVLGSEGFSSGTHCWDVDVRNKSRWVLGVLTESSLWYARTDVFSYSGLWYLEKDCGLYVAGTTLQRETRVRVTDTPDWIRVRLDLDRGKVTFSDPGNKKHLRTFRDSFAESVFPYFATHCARSPLKISPVNTTVTVQKIK